MGLSQIRLGPLKTRFLGIIQPILDGFKLFKKLSLINFSQIKMITSTICYFILFLSLIIWYLIPFEVWAREVNIIMLSILIMGVLSYIMLLIGWGSLNKYAYLGRRRRLSQILSFEVRLALVLIISFLLKKKIAWRFLDKIPSFFRFVTQFIFLFLILLDIQRSPADLAEGERELVRGYNTEFIRILFVLIFLSEYSSLLLMSIIFLILWKSINFLNLIIVILILILIRRCFPRVRYDHLINSIWLKILPIIIIMWLIISMF